MSKPFEALATVTFVFAILLSTLSIPVIEEKCLVCDHRVCPYNTNDSLRLLSVIDWAYDNVSDVHFMCFVRDWTGKLSPNHGKYDYEVK